MEKNTIKNILKGTTLLMLISAPLFLPSCENIDEVPPYKETTSGKTYKIPDPEPMNSVDFETFNEIRDEYQQATK